MSEDNVIDLEDGKKKVRKKKESASEKDETTFADLRYQIALAMDFDPLAPPGWPPFPARFHKIVDPIGKEAFLEENDRKIVKFVTKFYPPQVILNYAVNMLPNRVGFGLLAKQAQEIFYWWHSQRGALTEKPLVIAQKNDDRIAFARLPFDLRDVGDDPKCPELLADFLARCSNAEAVAAFIGSLFFAESYRQQYLYLHGDGQDGKGSIIRLLRDILGEGYQSIAPKTPSDRFWFMKTYGKRLCVVTDFVENSKAPFLTSPEMKALTGGDPIFYEGKGEGGFTDMSISKLIIASNYPPLISGQKADVRRLIYAHVLPPGSVMDVAVYEAKLKSEAQRIVEFCIATYRRVCPRHEAIPCDVPDDVVGDADTDYITLFEQYFDVCPGYQVAGHIVSECARKAGVRGGHEVQKLKECWKRVFGVTCTRKKEGILYHNMKVKYDGFSQ